MLKMVMALPQHIDGEKFVEMTMDIIKGRYGKDGYYSGVMPFADLIINPVKISQTYAKGFSGKNGLHYYAIGADELDPVIIATLEELGEMVGLKYNFVFENGKRYINKDWWRPFGNFQNAPNYYYSELAETARENYETTLSLLDPEYKTVSQLEFERKLKFYA